MKGWEAIAANDDFRFYKLAVVPAVFQSDLCWDIDWDGHIGRGAEDYMEERRDMPEMSGKEKTWWEKTKRHRLRVKGRAIQ